MNKITPKDLKPGDGYAFSTRKNAKIFYVSRVAMAVEEIKPPKFKCGPEHYGKYLIILDDCRQHELHPETVLYLWYRNAEE